LLDGSVLVAGGEQQVPDFANAWQAAKSAELFTLEPQP
jgi:hypothetical protein